jgi:hypothetical protein
MMLSKADGSATRNSSASDPSERVSYQREVAAVSERETCYLGYVEPPEVVVLCRRSINGISAPLLDEPDPKNESGLDDSDQFGPRLLDQYSQLLLQFTSQRLDGRFPVLHMPTGEVPYIWVPSPTSGAVAQQHSAVAHQQRGHDSLGYRCAPRHCIHVQTLPPHTAVRSPRSGDIREPD